MKPALTLPLLFVTLGVTPNLFRIHLPGDLGDLQHMEGIIYSIAFMIIWLAIFRKIWLAYATGLLFFSWWFIEIYLRTEFRSGISSGFLGMVRETNTQEFLSFLSTYTITIILPWIISMAIFTTLTIASYKAKQEWTHRSRYWVMTSFLALGVILYVFFEAQEPDDVTPMQDAFRITPPSFWLTKWGDTYPTNAIFAIRRNYQDQNLIKEIKSSIAQYRFDANQSKIHAPDTVVLIIGESSRRDRWSLFGYQKPTTPRLQERQGILLFNDIVTVSTATRTSVPAMISRQPVQNADGIRSEKPEPSIVALFKQLGYKTYWISNQSTSGFFDTPISLYASEADSQTFINPANFASRGSFDEALINPLDKILKKNEKKKFIIIHTMGSHFNYSYRYPKEFNKFQPSLSSDEVFLPSDPSKKIEASHSYDNSILYTDYFLDKVLERLEKTQDKSVAFFISDHGEDIFEPGCVSIGITRVSRKSYEIPAFLWSSSAYNNQWPEIIEYMNRIKNFSFTNKDAYPILLEASGISLNNTPPIQNRKERKVYAQGRWVDFDQEKERDACVIGRR